MPPPHKPPLPYGLPCKRPSGLSIDLLSHTEHRLSKLNGAISRHGTPLYPLCLGEGGKPAGSWVSEVALDGPATCGSNKAGGPVDFLVVELGRT